MALGDTCLSAESSWSDVCDMNISNLTGSADDEALERGAPTPTTQTTPVSADTAPAPVATQTSSPTITSIDPFDTQSVIQQLPTSADESANPVKPNLVFSSEPFTESGQTLRYVLVSYALAGDCHACEVTLGAAIFVKSGGNWTLNSWNADLATFGGYGKFGGTAEAFPLGGHSGVILRGSGEGQGETNDYATLLAESYGKLLSVWSGPTGLDDTGTDDCGTNSCAKWHSELKQLPTDKNGWSDLQLQTTGVGQRPDKSFGSMNQTQTLQFDGSTYVVTSTSSDASPTSPATSSPATSESTM